MYYCNILILSFIISMIARALEYLKMAYESGITTSSAYDLANTNTLILIH